jgi:hypothetical protein
MSIATAIAKFLHRTQTDTASTEAELKKVVDAVLPEVTSLKNATVDELRDDLAHAGTDMKAALGILSHEHKTDIDGAISTLESAFEGKHQDILVRLDGLAAKLETLKADVTSKTAPAKKALAAKAAAPAPATAADVKATPTK